MRPRDTERTPEQDHEDRGKRRRYAFRAIAVLAGCALGLAAYAVLDRALYVQPEDNRWPFRFDPELGVTFTPGATVVWAGTPGNRREFRAENTVNSWGFLDVEHAIEKLPGTRRVLVLGDSYVEGAQVGPDEKFPRLLERLLRGEERPVEVVALGYSGMGTVNLWPFWDRLGRRVAPDLVLLLVAYNDLKENSPELECRAKGWDPAHSPKWFLDLDAAGGFVDLPIDGDWRHHVREWSGRWDLGPWLSEGSPHWMEFAPYLAAHPGFRERPPVVGAADRYLGLPSEFAFYLPAEEWTPVMTKARILSAESARRLRDDATHSGARLALVFATSLVELRGEREIDGRPIDPGVQRASWSRIAADLDVPFLDLVAEFSSRASPQAAHFPVDGHWNAIGHTWAAEAVERFVRKEGLLD